MPTTLFVNATTILPHRSFDGCLRIDSGRIVEIAARFAPRPDEEVIDLGGDYRAPGSIDLHVHGGDGHDVRDGAPEAEPGKIADCVRLDRELQVRAAHLGGCVGVICIP